jgi:hypothetical protein
MAGQRILNPPFEGSIPSAPTIAVVARVAEQRIFNPPGAGSSPVDGTANIPASSNGRARVFEARCRGSIPRAGTANRFSHSSVAQRQGARLLTGTLQVRILPLELTDVPFV